MTRIFEKIILVPEVNPVVWCECAQAIVGWNFWSPVKQTCEGGRVGLSL